MKPNRLLEETNPTNYDTQEDVFKFVCVCVCSGSYFFNISQNMLVIISLGIEYTQRLNTFT